MAETGGQQWIRIGRIQLRYDSSAKEIEVIDDRSRDVLTTIPLDERGDLGDLADWLDMIRRLEASR